MRVEEVELPGVGRKFTTRTQSGAEVVIVVQHGGRRQMLCYDGGTQDEPAAVLELTNEEARELGAILGGVLFHPEQTGAATTAMGDQAIEWVVVPPGPLVGTTIRDLAGIRDAHVIALNRQGTLLPNPAREMRIEVGDTLVLAGTRGGVDALKRQVVPDA